MNVTAKTPKTANTFSWITGVWITGVWIPAFRDSRDRQVGPTSQNRGIVKGMHPFLTSGASKS